MQRSVRQGCPLSPLLFCIYIETLCLNIIENDKIRGFQLQAAEVKLLAYADDVAVFAVNREGVIEAVSSVKEFTKVSGSKVNWSKSLGLWHGEWPTTPEKFANMSWVTTPVKYLGVPLDSYRDSESYWRAQTQAMREKVEGWKGQQLSVFARAQCAICFLCRSCGT